MLYEVWIHYSGDYCCQVEADNDDEAKDIAKDVFIDDEDIGETRIEKYAVYELNEDE